jgi:C_GCAxxG_C_C family probable redox protein
MAKAKSWSDEEIADRTRAYMRQGFVCSQAVVQVMQELLGMRSRRTIRTMAGLGGGVLGMGEVCGALSGGVAALGLRFGRGDLSESGDRRLFFWGQELYGWFASLGECKPAGTVLCREIIKMNLRDPAGLARWFQSGRFDECVELTGRTAPQVAGILRREA